GVAAGVFTTNLMKAPPVKFMEERIRRGTLSAILANSGCANAYTGARGYRDAVEMALIGAETLGVSEDDVGVASTGVIGRYLDLPLVRDQCQRVVPNLARTKEAEVLAARAIMTTDITEKHAL